MKTQKLQFGLINLHSITINLQKKSNNNKKKMFNSNNKSKQKTLL